MRIRPAILTLLSAASLCAQSGNGRIQGTISDETAAIIPGAEVEVLHKATGRAFKTKTNESGFYLVPAAPTGEYAITVQFAGMAPWKGEFLLQSGETAAVNAALRPASSATEVTVVAEAAPLVTTTSGTIGSILERERIDQLPVNGRLIQNLITVTIPGYEHPSNFAFVNGTRVGGVEYMQDGASIVNRERSQIVSRPPGMDTVNEVRVETNGSSAKLNRPVTVLLTTRSGTNQFHGSAFETSRNNSLGIARRRQEFFQQAPQYIRNEFGASMGGPVLIPKLYQGRNRTFFFAAGEAYRLRQGSVTGTTVPTMAMREGDFNGLINAAGQRITIYDPWSTGAAPAYLRTPYPNNRIPISRKNRVAAYLWERTPSPTLPDVNPLIDNNLFAPSPSSQNNETYTVRIDHRFTDSDMVFGRFTYGHSLGSGRRTSSSNGSPILLDRSGNIESNPLVNAGGVVTWNHTFSPTLFVETAVSTTVEDSGPPLLPEEAEGQTTSELLKLPNLFGVPGLPDFLNTGFGMVYQGPRSSVTQFYGRILMVDQNYTWVQGRHQLEFGGRYRREVLETFGDPATARGRYTFNSSATALYDPRTANQYGATVRTGHDSANMFLGILATYQSSFTPLKMRFNGGEYAGYIQDNWRLTPRLTLNLGLRYEYYPPLYEQNGLAIGFDASSRSVVTAVPLDDMIRNGGTTGGIVQGFKNIGVKFTTPDQVGLPDRLTYANKMDFSPRAGFAWTITAGSRPWVLRGSYGMYRFPMALRTTVSQARSSPPMQGNFQQNFNSAAQTPDGLPNYYIRAVPNLIAGENTQNVLTLTQVPDIAPGSFSTSYIDPRTPTTRSQQWNLSLEKEVIRNTVLRLRYIGTHGDNLESWITMNGQATNYVWMVSTGTAPPTGRFANTARRIFDQTTYGNIDTLARHGFSNFNSLQAEVQRRFASGLAFQFFYVLSNSFRTLGIRDTGVTEESVDDPRMFLPGAVPTDLNERVRFLSYARDPNIPQNRIRWNWVYELPFGSGRKFGANSRGFMDYLIGGWQIAGSGTASAGWVTLPETHWGRFAPVEIYGKKYPVQDCRSGECVPGYLWYNGYISANRINSTGPDGKPNGVMGVPANYAPSQVPIYPTPANGGDPGNTLYETNQVMVRLNNGTEQRVAFDTGLHPYRNQLIPAPWTWSMDASVFKLIPIGERFKLRFNADVMNVLNMPGTPGPDALSGVISMRTSANTPRQLQLSLRLNW